MNVRYYIYSLFIIVIITIIILLNYITNNTTNINIDNNNNNIQNNNNNINNNNIRSSTSSTSNPSSVSTITTTSSSSSPSSSSHSSSYSSSSQNSKKKIAYAITITKDGPFLDGALVLGYSALISHSNSTKYIPELIAFVTSEVKIARNVLHKYGWKIMEKNLPVELHEIQNQDYMNRMKNSGCCGASEFLKLWAYTLTEYHRVVHLDMDTIIYQNMDELYDIDKELLYTGDYGMKGGSPVPPVQGGLLIVRPSVERFEELRQIIRIGDFGGSGKGGWAGTGIGNFWGGQTIQGILAYYYHSIHPNDGYELDRCIYNCMVDNPYRANTNICLNGQEKCDDCRLQTINKVKEAHFTICQKPWTCTYHNNPKNQVLCTELHNKWFIIRDNFEKSLNINLNYRQVQTRYKESMGMCKGYGDDKYIPIPIPG